MHNQQNHFQLSENSYFESNIFNTISNHYQCLFQSSCHKIMTSQKQPRSCVFIIIFDAFHDHSANVS